MGKCTRREKYTAMIPNITRSPNAQPGRSKESAAWPPGGTRDRVPCRGPRGLADPAPVEGSGRRLTPTQGPPLVTHPSPPGPTSQYRSFSLWAVPLELLVRNLPFCKDE